MTDTELYRLVLFNSEGSRVLLRPDGDLPEVCIPRFTRPAEQITSLLRTSWNVQAVLLWSGWIEAGQGSSRHFAILEVINHSDDLISFEWVATEWAASSLETFWAALVQSSQQKAQKICFGIDPEPFSRLGWIQRVKSWISGIATPPETWLLDFSQFNGSETFSLMRFETDSRTSLWFKAVGVPNLREFSITLLLSRLFPSYLPKILASKPLLNCWLMESGGELTLAD